jgi:hypothetical protein
MLFSTNYCLIEGLANGIKVFAILGVKVKPGVSFPFKKLLVCGDTVGEDFTELGWRSNDIHFSEHTVRVKVEKRFAITMDFYGLAGLFKRENDTVVIKLRFLVLKDCFYHLLPFCFTVT